jgi:hypothetical protein
MRGIFARKPLSVTLKHKESRQDKSCNALSSPD